MPRTLLICFVFELTVRGGMVSLSMAYRQNCCPDSRHMYQCQEVVCASMILIAVMMIMIIWAIDRVGVPVSHQFVSSRVPTR